MGTALNLVCNAGPVIALAKIDRLELLPKLGGASVSIPETVFHELLAKPGFETTRILHATRSFFEVKICPCDPPTQISESTRFLDQGEREVIVLATSFQPLATALIVDAAGRRIARQLGLPVLSFAAGINHERHEISRKGRSGAALGKPSWRFRNILPGKQACRLACF